MRRRTEMKLPALLGETNQPSTALLVVTALLGGPHRRSAIKEGLGFAAGIVLLIAGIIDHTVNAQKSALCLSGLGQVGQLFDETALRACNAAESWESVTGYLIVCGLLFTGMSGIALAYQVSQAYRKCLPGGD